MPDRSGEDAEAGLLHEVEKAPPGKRFERLYERRQKWRHASWINA